jgi:hypothetical protein
MRKIARNCAIPALPQPKIAYFWHWKFLAVLRGFRRAVFLCQSILSGFMHKKRSAQKDTTHAFPKEFVLPTGVS